jgi:hypothetical protein
MDKLKKKAILLGATDLKRSTRKGKKYMIKYSGKWIHFGAKNMLDYTQHKDLTRRKSYLARSKGIRNVKGDLTYNNKNKANYWARTLLWS